MHNFNINCIDNNTIDFDFTQSECNINCIHVKIKDFKTIVQEFETHISDTSWINSLDEIHQKTFKTNAQKTINKIVGEIIAKITTSVNEDIGEFIVSYSAQHALNVVHSHIKIPLAELLKEKISGNPGFDFHTISPNNYLIFGEAKFSLDSTPRAKALNQIEKFIDDKDNAELIWLKPFLDSTTESNIIKDEKGYAAAFSLNSENIITILNNALASDPIKKITEHKELYLVAVELC